VPVIELEPNRDGTFRVPRFSKLCACCGADAMGRIESYDPSTDHVQATPIDVPVCHECRDHALLRPGAPIIYTCMLVAGGSMAGLCGYFGSKRPEDMFVWTMLVIAAVVALAGLVLLARAIRFERAERERPGHAPWLVFSVDSGRARLITTSDRLSDELLALNLDARRRPTRAEAKAARIPGARVVKAGAPAVDPDEQASSIAMRVVANKPEDLAALRAELAAGTVPHVLVEQLLAETEAALGRRDLIARYRALRRSARP
jgi:hypothetical protein